jgi:IS30 family transposase
MYKQFTYEDRIKLSYLIHSGKSKIQIAKELGYCRKTIYNELNRNSSEGSYKRYSCDQAQKRRDERRKNCNKKTLITEEMISVINQQIGVQKWSPEQVKGRMQKEGGSMVSVETIYRYIYYTDKLQGGDLYLSLRQSHRTRRRRKNTKDKRGTIKERVSINNRPEIVNKRLRYGDFEADTMVGKNHKSCIATVTERKSLYTFIIPLKSREAKHTSEKICQALMKIKKYCHTITFDNGKEFSYHMDIARRLEVKTYFANPYSAFERGTNENINGLIRQFMPKKTDFNDYNAMQIQKIQNKLNERPRKKLGYKSPNEVFLPKCVTSN